MPATAAFTRLRQIAELLARLGQLEPIDTPAGLRQAIETLLALGRAIGLADAWLARLAAVLENDFAFRVVLALIRLATDAATAENHDSGIRIAAADGSQTLLAPQALADWLPFVIELLALLRALRGAK